MASLQVNIDHVATIRQARGADEPDPVHAAVLAELAGADGITVHLREDRRHIQDRDVDVLRETIRTRLNLEIAATDEMIGIAIELGPDQVTLVPEKREELTTEGGLDVRAHRDVIERAVRRLVDAGIAVSLFIDANRPQVEMAHTIGAGAVELHTGPYAGAKSSAAAEHELDAIRSGVALAWELGLEPHAGHGLNYRNVEPIAAIDGILDLNIGHSIVARGVLIGMERAVRDMVALIRASEGAER